MVKLSDVFSTMNANEYMIGGRPGFESNLDTEYVVIYDRGMCEEHGMNVMKRAYKILPGGDLEEIPIDTMVEEVKTALASRVNVGEILDQALRTGGPHTLLRIHEILKKHPEVKKEVSSRPGCLYLNVPNPKPGEPDERVYLRF